MLQNVISDQLFRKLESLDSGVLHLTTPDGKTRVFQGRNPGGKADIELRDWRVVSNMARKGDIGFAEDYRSGHWDTQNLIELLTLGLQNKRAFQGFVLGKKFSRFLSSISYLAKLNTLKGSKKNIHAHYDLGNEFYKLWLDPTMTYSSAIFHDFNEPLVNAQQNKYDRIIKCLNTQSGSVLEIGCGWGGFAERASLQGDYDIKGITLSEEQHSYACERLGERAEIVLQDYRHQEGTFDRIVSIEMFEAVGERYWMTYFKNISNLLKKNGKAVVQTITMNEEDFPQYRTGGDFIRTYIFPGGMLPSPSRFREEALKAGLKTHNEYYFGQGYAKTLEHWLHNFDQKRDEVKALGFDDSFIRLWRFYLAACVAGFKTERTNVMQVELSHA